MKAFALIPTLAGALESRHFAMNKNMVYRTQPAQAQLAQRNLMQLSDAQPAAADANSKYYFRVALPMGSHNFEDIVNMVKEGTILEVVENHVTDAFEPAGLSDLRFGWDGRLNPDDAATPDGKNRLKSLLTDPESIVLQFNVQGSVRNGFVSNNVHKTIQRFQSDQSFLKNLLQDNSKVSAVRIGTSVVANSTATTSKNCRVHACHPGTCSDRGAGYACGCPPPWEGDHCERFSDAGVAALKETINDLAKFEGQHNSDFTLFLTSEVESLEKNLRDQIAATSAASARISAVSRSCCSIWTHADGLTRTFRAHVDGQTAPDVPPLSENVLSGVVPAANNRVQIRTVNQEVACGLPLPNTPLPADPKETPDSPLIISMRNMHNRIAEWSQMMAGSRFEKLLTEKMNTVKRDLGALHEQAFVVSSNHDFVQEKCGNLESSLRELVGHTGFQEFNTLLRIKNDKKEETSVASQLADLIPQEHVSEFHTPMRKMTEMKKPDAIVTPAAPAADKK